MGFLQLIDAHEWLRLSISQDLMQRSLIEEDTFLEEYWLATSSHHYDPKTKRQIMEWKHSIFHIREKFKVQPSLLELMLTIFWDSQVPMYCYFLKDRRTINSQYYSKIWNTKFYQLSGVSIRGVISQQDNSCSQMAQLTSPKLQNLD